MRLNNTTNNSLLLIIKEHQVMKYYRLEYANGGKQIVSAKNDLELIRTYDLATREHADTRIIQLENDSLNAAIQALELSQA